MNKSIKLLDLAISNGDLQLWPEIPVISSYNPIYRTYNSIEITSYN